MNNPINSHPGKMCSCGKMCKNNRGLKIHQDKTKCQTPENNLVAPPQKCFVSLQNVILSSCLTFDDSIYYRTSDNTFIPISNSEKPVAGNKCYVQTKDIIIHPLTEYLSNDINQCGATSCHTCNIFVNNQSFKSNLTGKEYKTTQALHGLAPKCELINIHELIKKSTNNFVTLLPLENGINWNRKG